VDTVLLVYNRVKKELLPTPKKSHYTFNLRDINKVFQGVCSASIKFCGEPLQIVKLWYHENMRVFHDRLINQEDRTYLMNILKDLFPKYNFTDEQVLSEERIIFGDFQ
jgi:dynein heavy chain